MGILMESSDVNLVPGGHFGSVGAMEARREYYPETLHTFTINTRETDFGSIVEPIPITVKAYTAGGHIRPAYPHQPLNNNFTDTRPLVYSSVATNVITPTNPTTPSPKKEEVKLETSVTHPPPKKKWIKEYLEEEPSISSVAVSRPLVGVVCASPTLTPVTFTTEHSRPRIITNIHGLPPQIPSPPLGCNGSSSGSNGSTGPRSGTREVHNKLEKNRRAHLKECFELLKRHLPTANDDKKSSNLSILGSAIRYIQVLRRKERECEHEMERLAREKITAQQKLAALKREVSTRAVRAKSATSEDKDVDERLNGQVLGVPITMAASPLLNSPPRSLNLSSSTKLRTLPIHLTPTTSQVVQTSYGSRHNTLTLTTLAPVETTPTTQLGVVETRRVVVGGLQLLAPPLLLTHNHINGVSAIDSSRSPKQNGIVSTATATDGVTSVVVSPIVVSNSQHILHHSLTHKMVERQVVKGGVSVSSYINNSLVSNGFVSNGLVSNGLVSNGLVSNGLVSNSLVSPVVVVSTSATPPSTSV